MQSYDVVIAGGAIMGASVAWFLSQQPSFKGRILVVEKDISYQRCSTTLSLSSIRQQFSTEVNIRISRFGFEFLRSVDRESAANGGIGLAEQGYLFLASKEGKDQLLENIEVQRREGADTEFLSPKILATRYPWLNVEGIAGAGYGRRGEGYFDAYSLLQYFIRGAKQRGVNFVHDEVIGLDIDATAVRAVLLADGNSCSCDYFVNTAGTGAVGIAGMAGISLPIESRKRCVFVIDCPGAARLGDCPHLIDHSGVFLKPMGPHFVTGAAPPPGRDLPCCDFVVDHELFAEVTWPLLAKRVPEFERAKVVNSWAGHYAYNLLDQNAIIGPHPKIGNFFMANGFSGHGVQQAPAVGRAISELIVHNTYQTLDLTELGFDRILEGRPVLEKSIV